MNYCKKKVLIRTVDVYRFFPENVNMGISLYLRHPNPKPKNTYIYTEYLNQVSAGDIRKFTLNFTYTYTYFVVLNECHRRYQR